MSGRANNATAPIIPTTKNKVPEGPDNPAGQQWANFNVPKHPFFLENEKVLKPTSDWQNAYTQRKLEQKMQYFRKSKNPEDAVVVNNRKIEIETSRLLGKNTDEQASRDFINEFILWMMGTSKTYNTKNYTWWENKPLAGKEIKEFITEVQTRRTDYQIEIEKLQANGNIRIPNTLWDAWIYFKYIVTNKVRDPTTKQWEVITSDYFDDFALYLEMTRNKYVPDEIDVSAEPFYGCLGKPRGVDFYSEDEVEEFLLDGTKVIGADASEKNREAVERMKKIEDIYNITLDNMREEFLQENDIETVDSGLMDDYQIERNKFINNKTKFLRDQVFTKDEKDFYRPKTLKQVEDQINELKLKSFKNKYEGFVEDRVLRDQKLTGETIDEYTNLIEEDMKSVDDVVEILSDLNTSLHSKKKLRSMLSGDRERKVSKEVLDDLKYIEKYKKEFSNLKKDSTSQLIYDDDKSLRQNVDDMLKSFVKQTKQNIKNDMKELSQQTIQKKFEEEGKSKDLDHYEKLKGRLNEIQNRFDLSRGLAEGKKLHKEYENLASDYEKILSQRNKKVKNILETYMPGIKVSKEEDAMNLEESINFFLTQNQEKIDKKLLTDFLNTLSNNKLFVKKSKPLGGVYKPKTIEQTQEYIRVLSEELKVIPKLEKDVLDYASSNDVPEKQAAELKNKFTEMAEGFIAESGTLAFDNKWSTKLEQMFKDEKVKITTQKKTSGDLLKQLEKISGEEFSKFSKEQLDAIIEQGTSNNKNNINLENIKKSIADAQAYVAVENGKGFIGKNRKDIIEANKIYDKLVPDATLLEELLTKTNMSADDLEKYLRKFAGNEDNLKKKIEKIEENVPFQEYKNYVQGIDNVTNNTHLDKVRELIKKGDSKFLSHRDFDSLIREVTAMNEEEEDKRDAFVGYESSFKQYTDFFEIKDKTSAQDVNMNDKAKEIEHLNSFPRYKFKQLKDFDSASSISSEANKISAQIKSFTNKYISMNNSFYPKVPPEMRKYFSEFNTITPDINLMGKLYSTSNDIVINDSFKKYNDMKQATSKLTGIVNPNQTTIPPPNSYDSMKEYKNVVDQVYNNILANDYISLSALIDTSDKIKDVTDKIASSYFSYENGKKTAINASTEQIIKTNSIKSDISNLADRNRISDETLRNMYSYQYTQAENQPDLFRKENMFTKIKNDYNYFVKADTIINKVKLSNPEFKNYTPKDAEQLGILSLTEKINEKEMKDIGEIPYRPEKSPEELRLIGENIITEARSKFIIEFNKLKNQVTSVPLNTNINQFLVELNLAENTVEKYKALAKEDKFTPKYWIDLYDLTITDKLRKFINKDTKSIGELPRNIAELNTLEEKYKEDISKLDKQLILIRDDAFSLSSEKMRKNILNDQKSILSSYQKQVEDEIKDIARIDRERLNYQRKKQDKDLKEKLSADKKKQRDREAKQKERDIEAKERHALTEKDLKKAEDKLKKKEDKTQDTIEKTQDEESKNLKKLKKKAEKTLDEMKKKQKENLETFKKELDLRNIKIDKAAKTKQAKSEKIKQDVNKLSVKYLEQPVDNINLEYANKMEGLEIDLAEEAQKKDQDELKATLLNYSKTENDNIVNIYKTKEEVRIAEITATNAAFKEQEDTIYNSIRDEYDAIHELQQKKIDISTVNSNLAETKINKRNTVFKYETEKKRIDLELEKIESKQEEEDEEGVALVDPVETAFRDKLKELKTKYDEEILAFDTSIKALESTVKTDSNFDEFIKIRQDKIDQLYKDYDVLINENELARMLDINLEYQLMEDQYEKFKDLDRMVKEKYKELLKEVRKRYKKQNKTKQKETKQVRKEQQQRLLLESQTKTEQITQQLALTVLEREEAEKQIINLQKTITYVQNIYSNTNVLNTGGESSSMDIVPFTGKGKRKERPTKRIKENGEKEIIPYK